MKNNLSFEKELEQSRVESLSTITTGSTTPSSLDIYSLLFNLYFKLLQEPVPIISIPYLYKKTDKKVISLYQANPSIQQNNIEEESDFITTFKSLNSTSTLIKKDLIDNEDKIVSLFNCGFDSFYLYANSLDIARLQYYIEIAREYKTEAIVLIANLDEAKLVLSTDAKIVGVTDRNYFNQKLPNVSSKRSLFEFLIDTKPELVLVHDVDL